MHNEFDWPRVPIRFPDHGGRDFCRCSWRFYHLDSWLDAVVMVGVMSVNTQLAQSSSVRISRQDWPRDTWAERPCWQRQDVNLLPRCQHLRCEMRCDDFYFFKFFYWQNFNKLATQCTMGQHPAVVGSHSFQLHIWNEPSSRRCSRAPIGRIIMNSSLNTAEITQPHHFMWSTGKY